MHVKSYRISLFIDEANYTFRGSEEISLQSDAERLSLDSVGLNIGSVSVDSKASEFSVTDDALSIPGIEKGDHSVRIEFEGPISQSLTGLYLAKTREGDMFSTQFESTGARRVFPCIDNPGYKAEFELTLNIADSLEAISNMPPASTMEEGGRKTVVFQKTPRMSTYLLYIGVGDFEHKRAKHRDVDVILTAPRGHLSQSDFPLQVAVKCLKIFEEYFGINYMLPKMHLISVPEFGAGAMENWGALTFREVLLYADDHTGSRTRKRIASVIAHEIAHQWFGDLVTMKWWNDLWLNESFATFMAYRIINELYPEMDAFGELVSTRTSGALTDDSLENSHPIDVEVSDPNSVAQIFDQISYGKGASVLRMMEAFVGKENFRKGISSYLKKHSYSNTMGSDLWNSIEDVSGLPVNRIMEAWIKKQGYPYVQVSEEGGDLKISQKRFLLGSEGGGTWPVPLTLVRGNGVESIVLDSEETVVSSKGFIKLNSAATGFYRSMYSHGLLSELLGNPGKTQNLDRWGLASDYYAFLLSGKVGLDDYLSLIEGMRNERDPLVMEEIASQLLRLHMKAPASARLREYALSIMNGFLNAIGDTRSEGEDMNVSILRGQLSQHLAVMDPQFASRLAGRFENLDREDPDMKAAVIYAYAVSSNDFGRLVERMDSTGKDEDKTIIIGALAWLREDDLLEKANRMVLDGKIKRQDSMGFFASLASSPTSRDFSFRHLEESIEFLRRIFTGSRRAAAALEGIIPLVGMGRSEELQEKLEALRAPDTEPGIRKGLELLSVNERFRNLYGNA